MSEFLGDLYPYTAFAGIALLAVYYALKFGWKKDYRWILWIGCACTVMVSAVNAVLLVCMWIVFLA